MASLIYKSSNTPKSLEQGKVRHEKTLQEGPQTLCVACGRPPKQQMTYPCQVKNVQHKESEESTTIPASCNTTQCKQMNKYGINQTVDQL